MRKAVRSVLLIPAIAFLIPVIFGSISIMSAQTSSTATIPGHIQP